MNILIKGVDISPDHIQCITVFPEGFAIIEEYEMGLPIKTTKCEVVPVPTPHGRLIDADEIIKHEHQHYEYLSDEFYIEVRDVENAPTIIEAEKSK